MFSNKNLVLAASIGGIAGIICCLYHVVAEVAYAPKVGNGTGQPEERMEFKEAFLEGAIVQQGGEEARGDTQSEAAPGTGVGAGAGQMVVWTEPKVGAVGEDAAEESGAEVAADFELEEEEEESSTEGEGASQNSASSQNYVPYDRLYDEWHNSRCEQFVPIFKNTLTYMAKITGDKFIPCIFINNTLDDICVNIGDKNQTVNLENLLRRWKEEEKSCMLQIEYDYLYSDIDTYPGYEGTNRFDTKDGWYHIATAVYNHKKNILTYIDSIGKDFTDDDDMPVEVAKDAHATRRVNSYLDMQSWLSDVTFESARQMYGWDGWNYERTPPQQMETANDEELRSPHMTHALSAWGESDRGTCFLWSLLIADDLIHDNVTGKEWSIAFAKEHSTSQASQLYISHRLISVLASCKRELTEAPHPHESTKGDS